MGKMRGKRPQTSKRKAKSEARTGKEGTLIAHYGVAVDVLLDDQTFLKHVKVKRKSGHVVGDRVSISEEILTRLERNSELRRRDPGGGTHVLAANLDIVFVVCSHYPELKPGLVDRAIVAARAGGIKPIVVVNKSDLPGSENFLASIHDAYGDDLEILHLSARAESKEGLACNSKGAKILQETLNSGQKAALIGPSGVGKSSLLNALLPEAKLLEGVVSEATGKGRHTTVVSTLHPLKEGCGLVDTPGIRDFGLVHVEPTELAQYFAGIAVFHEEGCKFRNCLHHGEPQCAIAKAFDDGKISWERLKTYRALLSNLLEAEEEARRHRTY